MSELNSWRLKARTREGGLFCLKLFIGSLSQCRNNYFGLQTNRTVMDDKNGMRLFSPFLSVFEFKTQLIYKTAVEICQKHWEMKLKKTESSSECLFTSLGVSCLIFDHSHPHSSAFQCGCHGTKRVWIVPSPWKLEPRNISLYMTHEEKGSILNESRFLHLHICFWPSYKNTL